MTLAMCAHCITIILHLSYNSIHNKIRYLLFIDELSKIMLAGLGADTPMNLYFLNTLYILQG